MLAKYTPLSGKILLVLGVISGTIALLLLQKEKDVSIVRIEKNRIPIIARESTRHMVAEEEPVPVFPVSDHWIPNLLVTIEIPLPEHPSPPPPPPPADTALGVYLTGNSIARTDGFFAETIESLTKHGGTALVIDVKESDVFYDTESKIAETIHAKNVKYKLTEVVEKAHEAGLYVIARFVAAKDRRLAQGRPETQIFHPETRRSVGDTWIDLSHSVTLLYNYELLKEVAASGVDEINIDYIRYPTEYAPNYIGLTGEEKADRVESFLQMARDVIDESGKDVKLGISTYAILGWYYDMNLERLGQDYVRLAPIVDVISPMAYPASFSVGGYYQNRYGRSRMYELVRHTLEGYKEQLGEDHAWKIRPWIQGYRVEPTSMRDQIDAVYDAGSCGFTVWSPSNLYEPLYSVLTTYEVPEACRKPNSSI